MRATARITLERDASARETSSGHAWKRLPVGWSKLPPPPFVRHSGVALWTGRHLILWGGEDLSGKLRADGAAYDASAGRWRALPHGPLPARSRSSAVWTGKEVLIWGGQTNAFGPRGAGAGAAFEPETRSWRMLPAAPLTPRVPVAAVWTGREVIVWGDTDRSRGAVDGAAYDPARNEWRVIPDAPVALNQAAGVWTGKELVLYGALLDGRNWPKTESAEGAAYDPETTEWRVVARHGLSPQASTIAWTGNEVVAWDYLLDAAAYEPASDRWSALPRLPLRPMECYPASVVAGRALLAWDCGQAALLDMRTRTWTRLVPPRAHDFGRLVSAGGVALFVGTRRNGRRAAFWAYKPEEWSRAATATQRP